MNTTLWTPRFIVLCLANICNSLVFFLLASSTATIATQDFGAGSAEAGLTAGVFFVGGVLARAASGPVAERLGLRVTLVTAKALYALTSASYLIVASLDALIVLRFVNGLTFGFVATALTSAALSGLPPRRRGEGTGWFTSGMALGTGIGPLIALNLLRVEGGTRVVLILTAIAALLGLLLVLGIARQLPGRVREPAAAPRGRAGLGSRMVEPRVLPIAFTGLLAATAFGVVLTYLNEFTTGTSLQQAAGFYFLVYAASMLLLRPPMGRLQDRRGNHVVIIPACAGVVAGMVFTAFAQSATVLLIGAALLGFGYGTFVSSGQAMALNLVDPGRSTVAIASFFLLVDLGTGLGPALLGSFAPLVGFRGVFALGAGVAAFGFTLYLVRAARDRRQPGDAA